MNTRKIFALAIILFGSTAVAFSQSQGELIKLYEHAIASKDYKNAAQYAFRAGESYNPTDVDKANNYFNLSITSSKKISDYRTAYDAYHSLASNYQTLKKYTKATENLENALSAAQRLKDSRLVKDALINLATGYALAARYKKSIEYAEEALSIAIDENDSSLQQTCYQLLAEYYTRQGNKMKASEYQAHYNLMIAAQKNEEQKKIEVKQLRQSIAKVGREQQLTQNELLKHKEKLALANDSLRRVEDSLRTTMDSLKAVEEINKNRALEINLLQKDKELAEARIKAQEATIENETLVRNFIIVGTLLSIALIIVLVISYRKKVKANEKIDLQNKNIKSSINYAKRIQEAMLPKTELHPEIFEKSFILFMPRDTVSGDFYWLSDVRTTEHETDIGFAAVDCTGHGVPGAFMSMIGINALNGIVNRGTTETNKILDSLDYEIRTALKQDTSGNNDGMDIALCVYRPSKKILEFSGAKNPLVYVQDNKLFQVKGDVHSIGGSKHKHQFFYKKHEIVIDKPTVIYLFSDGYKDQFGGKDNAKFMSKKLNELLLSIHFRPMAEQMKILQETITTWKGTRDQTDDILVMGMKLEPNR